MTEGKSNNAKETMLPELGLMLAAACGDKARTESLLKLPINWEVILRLVLHNQVYPMVYKTLSQLEARIPESIITSLRAHVRENVVNALRMTSETVRIVSLLENNGVCVVVLKGMPLAFYLYDGDITLRPSTDIDILLLDERLDLVRQILEEDGYYEAQPELDLTPRQRQIYTKTYRHPHHAAFWHREKNVLVEIHWDMGHFGQVVLPMPSDASITRIQVAGSSLPVLVDEEWLLYLVLHGASHAWYRLRWVVDIARFIQRDIDWERADSLANSLGMQSVLHHALMLASTLLEVPLSADYRPIVFSDRNAVKFALLAKRLYLSLSCHLVGKFNGNRDNYWLYIYNYLMRVGWRNRIRYILDLWRPTADDIRLISLPAALYPLYYAIRPFTFVYGIFVRSGSASMWNK
jgi:hypothetical protein